MFGSSSSRQARPQKTKSSANIKLKVDGIADEESRELWNQRMYERRSEEEEEEWEKKQNRTVDEGAMSNQRGVSGNRDNARFDPIVKVCDGERWLVVLGMWAQ